MLINAYLDQRDSTRHNDEPLFLTVPAGRQGGGKPMDRQAIGKLIRRIATAAGIPSAARLTPHSLRHTFITLVLDAGAALRDVQDAAGHANANTTRAYDRNRGRLARHPGRTGAGTPRQCPPTHLSTGKRRVRGRCGRRP